MTRETIRMVAAAGTDKIIFARKTPLRFVCRAVLAGFFIAIGTLLSSVCGAILFQQNPEVARLLAAASFSSALILIVFFGGELFTGATLIMTLSVLDRRCRPRGVLRVWLLCYAGNFIGIVFLCALFSLSGAVTPQITSYISLSLPVKLYSPWYILLLRAVLCNFLVCLGVFSGFRLKSEGARALVIFIVITSFILLGLEHSIANMAIFALSALFLPSPDLGAMALNLLVVTVGNVIGGVFLCALPLWFSVEKEEEVCLK